MNRQAGECEHDWQLVEVAIAPDAADTAAVCTRCGVMGVDAGQGRRIRPELPEIHLTAAEYDALRQQRQRRGSGGHAPA